MKCNESFNFSQILICFPPDPMRNIHQGNLLSSWLLLSGIFHFHVDTRLSLSIFSGLPHARQCAVATGIALKTQERRLAPRGLYSSVSQFTQATEQKIIKIKVKNMCSLKVLPRFIATFVFINISVKKKKKKN